MVCGACIAAGTAAGTGPIGLLAIPGLFAIGKFVKHSKKRKKPSSKKPSSKKPSSKKKKKLKGGGGTCPDCYDEECSKCEMKRLDEEKERIQEINRYLEDVFEKDAIKYLQKIQEETIDPCRSLIKEVQDHANKKIKFLDDEGELSYSDFNLIKEYIQEINQVVLDSSSKCLEDGKNNINNLKSNLRYNRITKDQVIDMLNDPSFIPKSCIVCGERFDLEKEKNDKSIAGRKRTKTPRIDRELQDQLVPIAPYRGDLLPLDKKRSNKLTKKKKTSLSSTRRSRRGKPDPTKGHKSVGDVELLNWRVHQIMRSKKLAAQKGKKKIKLPKKQKTIKRKEKKEKKKKGKKKKRERKKKNN